MNIRERMLAVLNGEKPDRIPFICFPDLFPRGSFERYLRNNGMGLMQHALPVETEMPNVSTTTRKTEKGHEIIYHTPKGDISVEDYLRTGRQSHHMWPIKAEFFLKEVEDYIPLISMIEDTVNHIEMEEFKLKDLELGEDGLLVVQILPSYTKAEYLLLGLEKWGYEQYDHPEEFNQLLQALDNSTDDFVDKLSSIDYDMLVTCGDISDNVDPEKYRKYEVPFLERSFDKLRGSGKKCGIHAHGAFLKRHKEWLDEIEPDYIESYTPPPYSDIQIDELREALGEDVVILINFPETVFYKGYYETKKYTIDLLKRDPGNRKMMGITEMGLMGVNEKERKIFENGLRAIIDALDEVS